MEWKKNCFDFFWLIDIYFEIRIMLMLYLLKRFEQIFYNRAFFFKWKPIDLLFILTNETEKKTLLQPYLPNTLQTEMLCSFVCYRFFERIINDYLDMYSKLK